MSGYKALGGRILTKPFLVLLVIWLIGSMFGVQRFFMDGMGAVSNLNGGYAWGIWVVYDVVVGTAFACGGYALAIVVYVLNKGKYHPLIRSALLASLLGYALGGFGAFFDMGRFWQFYEIFLPSNWNFNSVMLEVGLCVASYIIVLALEFSPVVLERFGMQNLLKKLNKVLFFLIALGVLLPTMHQSSLGTILVNMGYKVHPLWQSLHMQPLLALITAIIMGFSIVVYEESTLAVSFGRKAESPLLSGLSKVAAGLIAAYLLIRFATLIVQGKLGLIFAFDLGSVMFILETALFVVPLVILLSPSRKSRSGQLLIAAVCMLLAGALYRFDAFLITYNPGPGYSYFPSAPEIMITFSIIALELMIYLVVIKTMPVLHREEHA